MPLTLIENQQGRKITCWAYPPCNGPPLTRLLMAASMASVFVNGYLYLGLGYIFGP